MSLQVSNLGELKTAVQEYLDRPELTAKIPLFIQMGERKIYRLLRCAANLKKQDVSLLAGNDGTFNVPADYLSTRMLVINGAPVERISDISATKRLATEPAGTPDAFTVLNGKFQFVPIPDGAADVSLHYYADLSGELVSDTDTNNVLISCLDAYIYASCLEATQYLKHDERIQVWAQLFQNAIESANALQDEGEYSGSGLSVGAASGIYGGF